MDPRPLLEHAAGFQPALSGLKDRLPGALEEACVYLVVPQGIEPCFRQLVRMLQSQTARGLWGEDGNRTLVCRVTAGCSTTELSTPLRVVVGLGVEPRSPAYQAGVINRYTIPQLLVKAGGIEPP